MVQKFFEPCIERDILGSLAKCLSLLAGGHDLVKGVHKQRQVFPLHQELVYLKELVIGEGFSWPRYDQTVKAVGDDAALEIDISDGVIL